MFNAKPPTIPDSGNFDTVEVEKLSVGDKLFNINNPKNSDVIGYDESIKSWIPMEMAPLTLQTTGGVISNLIVGTRWIDWGVRTDGQAATFYLSNGSYRGFTFSYNNLNPINTGADPTTTWTVELGLVYDGVETNIDCATTSANFHPFDSFVLTKAQVDAGNGFPQINNIPKLINFTGPVRISARSTATGSWNFNNGDIVINVYLAINLLNL